MNIETAKELEALLLGMDTSNIHIVSYGKDGGGVCISSYYPNIAVGIRNMLLAMVQRDAGTLSLDCVFKFTVKASDGGN